MPDNEKLTIELDLEGKQFQKEMSNHLKAITRWSKQSAKESKNIAKALGDIKDVLKDLSKGYKDVGTAAQEAGKKQARATKQATEELKRQESTLTKIKNLLSKAGRHDVGTGFAGGLMRGTGLAGIYGSLRGPAPGARLGGALGRGAMGVAARGVGFGISGIQNAYQTYLQYGQAQFGMAGLGTPGQFRRGMRGAGGRLGFTPTESAGMGAGVARATGGLRSVGMAQQLALAGGFGPGGIGEAISLMGTMRQAGAGFEGTRNQQARRKDLSQMIALGMVSGLEKARLPEFFAGVGGLVRSQFATAAGKVDANVIAKQLSHLGMTGKAGFQGARGAQVMGQLDAMIRRPGGGEAGQAMILQAMGFGKPGGKVNYYEAVRKQQKGIRDPENIKRVMQEVYKQHGVVAAGGNDPRNREANLIMSQLSGLSLEQVEELKNIYTETTDAKKAQKKVEEVLKKAEPIDKQALRVAREGFTGVKQHLAGIEQMQIYIGGKAAPVMMTIQNAQLKLLSEMIKWVQPLSEWLKENHKALVNMAVDIKRWVTGKGEEAALAEFEKKSDERISKIYGRKTSTVGQMIQREADLAEAYRKHNEERTKKLVEGGGFSRIIAGAMDVATGVVGAGTNILGEQRKARLAARKGGDVQQRQYAISKSMMARAAEGLKPEFGKNEEIQLAIRKVGALARGNLQSEENRQRLFEAVQNARRVVKRVQGPGEFNIPTPPELGPAAVVATGRKAPPVVVVRGNSNSKGVQKGTPVGVDPSGPRPK